MAQILKGSEVATAIGSRLSAQVEALGKRGITPVLAIVRIGEIIDQVSYANSAVKRCETYGVSTQNIVLPGNASQDEVISKIRSLSQDENVHGVLLLRPLPEHIDDAAVRAALSPDKDVDGITDTSLAGVFAGTGAGFAPCTARACMEILKHFNIDCTGKRAVVIGRSLVVGKPVAIMLMGENATVTVCHTKTKDIPSISRSADIVIAATGQLESLTAGYFSPGQVVIDVGINWCEKKNKLCGDVLFEDAEPIVAAITPVPGGVGSVTTAVLVSNVVTAAARMG